MWAQKNGSESQNQSASRHFCWTYKVSITLFASSVWEHGQEMCYYWEDRGKGKRLQRLYEHLSRSGNLMDGGHISLLSVFRMTLIWATSKLGHKVVSGLFVHMGDLVSSTSHPPGSESLWKFPRWVSVSFGWLQFHLLSTPKKASSSRWK